MRTKPDDIEYIGPINPDKPYVKPSPNYGGGCDLCYGESIDEPCYRCGVQGKCKKSQS